MSSNTFPSYSIVIRAYNEEEHIGRLLEGIVKQSVQPLETILVDSGSTDATIDIAKRYQIKLLHIKPEDFTFGRSLNHGIDHAHGEIILIASAHVYPVFPDWVEQMLRPFTDPKVGLVYGKQRGNSTTKFSEHQHFAKMYPDQSNSSQESPVCNNANAAIRRELWIQHKYDEGLPGLEDLAWAAWVVSQGYYLAYAAEAEVIHVHQESSRQVYNRYRREAMALKSIRPEERFGLVDLTRLYTSNVLSDMWHAVQDKSVFSNLWPILRFRWSQFWGTYRGFAISGPLTKQLKRTFFYPRGFKRSSEPAERSMDPIDYRVSNANPPADSEE
jgi:glycosyltransferase involved in cell wall biosynthesis